jgi:polyisoprenoid-binding protein YceI
MATSTATTTRVSTWELDPAHSGAHFSIRHMMVSTVRGEFGKVAGVVKLDEADPTRSTVQATIDVSSINTRDPQRDAHLRSAEFFDVEKFPSIDFKSTSIVKTGADTYELTGQLTLHGITREVTLKLEAASEQGKDPWGKLRRGATATGTLNRKDFGLNWNQVLETGGILVGDEVKLTIDVELVKSE